MSNPVQSARTSSEPKSFLRSTQFLILVIMLPFSIGGSLFGSGIYFKSKYVEVNIPPYATFISQHSPSIPGVDEAQIREKLKTARRTLPIAKVLWLDDNPQNNRDARDQLGNIGIFCDNYTNSSQALTAARAGDYDMVISNAFDWSMNSRKSRIEFLSSIRASNIRSKTGQPIPFLYYSEHGAYAPDIVDAAKLYGASAPTSHEGEVLSWVVQNIPPR